MNALRRIVRMIRLADRDASRRSVSRRAALRVALARDAPASSLAELAGRTLTDQSSVSTVVAKLVATEARRAHAERDRPPARRAAADRRRQQARDELPRVLPQTRIVDAVAAMPRERRAASSSRRSKRLVAAIGANELEPRMFECREKSDE